MCDVVFIAMFFGNTCSVVCSSDSGNAYIVLRLTGFLSPAFKLKGTVRAMKFCDFEFCICFELK